MPLDPSSSGVDLILGIGALLAVLSLVRSWRSFVDDDFTKADRQVAMQVSVFLVPPVAVLLHELGHVAAALAVGAEVTDFNYGLFEGSVGVVGDITLAQDWFVAMGGNLVSALVGLTMVAVGARATGIRRSFRYVLIFGGLFVLVFALVGYPLLSATANFGDWLVIYDFSATPTLSWATAVIHLSTLGLLWRWWRQDLRIRLFGITHGREQELAALLATVRRAPDALKPRLALANHFAGRGDLGLAGATLDEGVARVNGPDAARLHLARSRVALHRGRWNTALLATRAGLEAGTLEPDLEQRLWANQGLALAQMDRPQLALAAFERLGADVADDARVLYCRGIARMATGDDERGRSDLEVVVARRPEGDPLRRWAETRLAGADPRRAADGHEPAGSLNALGGL